jgi:hypothetical protein
MTDRRLEPAQVALTVRPRRRLTFVPIVKHFDWRLSSAAVLARHCSAWGGIGDLLMPLDESTEDRELFWSIALRTTASVGPGATGESPANVATDDLPDPIGAHAWDGGPHMPRVVGR